MSHASRAPLLSGTGQYPLNCFGDSEDPPSLSQLIIVGGAEQSANHIPWPQ